MRILGIFSSNLDLQEARKRLKRKAQDNSEQLREKLLDNLLKQQAVNQLLGKEDVPSSSQMVDDMYALPPLPEKDEDEEFELVA